MSKHAIVIGIGWSSLGGPLISAAEDARRLSGVLEGQYAPVVLQPNDQWVAYPVIAKNAAPSYSGSQLHLSRTFDSWVQWVNQREDQDRSHVLIYFAGHAGKRGDEDVELLASDNPWITLRALARTVNGIKARNVTVILDCCHAGNFNDEFSRLAEATGGSRDGRAVFAACSEDEEALGYRDKSGAFTNLILKGLGADLSVPEGPVTARNLEDYLKDNWGSLPKEVTKKQRLVALASRSIGNDIPLVNVVREPAPAVRVDDAANPQQAVASVDGPLGNIRANRTNGGAEIYSIAPMTGELHPWRVRVSLDPSERLLAITTSVDNSTAWLAVSSESATHVMRVRERDGAHRLVVPGATAARRAGFGGGGERDLLVLETVSAGQQRVWVRTLRPLGEMREPT